MPQFVEDGTEENVEGIKYDFTFGNRFLKAHFTVPKDYDNLSSDDLQHAFVEPGEVVFVLSKEKLKLPNNIYIQLSPKRSLAHDGIELLGELTVDPLYEGCLVFEKKISHICRLIFSYCKIAHALLKRKDDLSHPFFARHYHLNNI